jgi:hypothetical protein
VIVRNLPFPRFDASSHHSIFGVAVALVSATNAHASGTTAGTKIDNTAIATYSLPGGGSGSVSSNTVSLTVDELLNVGVAWSDGGDVAVQPSSSNDVLSFRITNGGNGSEAFTLTARNSLSGDNFDPSSFAIYLDSNGNGRYDPAIDQAYVAGSNEPGLAADASTTAFIVSTVPGTVIDGNRSGLDLIATAKTGSGTPGTTFAGLGDGGVNAVVGATRGTAQGTGFYAVTAVSVAFVKSATVADPFGGTTSVPGSTITYRLVATLSGSGSLPSLDITDTVPAGASYKSGSLKLDSSALTDAVDGDAGSFASNAIAVAVGAAAAGTSHAVTFQVIIR